MNIFKLYSIIRNIESVNHFLLVLAIVWTLHTIGGIAAMIGSFPLCFLDHPDSASVMDSGYGALTTNSIVENALKHTSDELEFDNFNIGLFSGSVIMQCVVALLMALRYIKRRNIIQNNPIKKKSYIKLLLLLAISPVVFTIIPNIPGKCIFQLSRIINTFNNKNTFPNMVKQGSLVEIIFPTNIESVSGYYRCESFKIDISMAVLLPTGKRVHVSWTEAKIIDSGHLPSKEESKKTPEKILLRLQYGIPDDKELVGAMLNLQVTGDIDILNPENNMPTKTNFDVSTRFRIATQEEINLRTSYDNLSIYLTRLYRYSLPTAFFIFAVLVLFTKKPGVFTPGYRSR